MNVSIITHDTDATEEIGRQLAEQLLAAGRRRAFLSLCGEMGVGKTAFARGFASALGIDCVHSPTYTVVNEYRGTPLPVFHFDLYRLSDEDELYAIGFDDYLAREGYVLCEWSERAGELLPSDRITVEISRVTEDENHRKIRITGRTDEDSCS